MPGAVGLAQGTTGHGIDVQPVRRRGARRRRLGAVPAGSETPSWQAAVSLIKSNA